MQAQTVGSSVKPARDDRTCLHGSQTAVNTLWLDRLAAEVQSSAMEDAGSHVAVNGGGGKAADIWARGNSALKRKASDSNLLDFERFQKRLHQLSISPLARSSCVLDELVLIHVVTGDAEKTHDTRTRSTRVTNHPSPSPSDGRHSRPQPVYPSSERDDMMAIDDTRDRVYIPDLDAELADIELDEEKLIFLPDIEKKFSKLPQQVLYGSRDDDHDGQELVLYGVPKSLTVDEGRDSVRKAIIESRERAREKAAEDARHADMERKYDHSDYDAVAETAHGYNAGYLEDEDEDPDAMDIG